MEVPKTGVIVRRSVAIPGDRYRSALLKAKSEARTFNSLVNYFLIQYLGEKQPDLFEPEGGN